MKKISSSSLFVSKRLFPAVWFGIIAFVFIDSILRGSSQPVAYIAPVVMAAIGVVVMKKLVWDLVDEVHDLGDHLLIKKSGEEELVPLSGIMNVSVSTNQNPPRITLRLVKPGKFGSEVAFSPASSFTINPFAKNAVAEDLIVRVDRSRSKRAV